MMRGFVSGGCHRRKCLAQQRHKQAGALAHPYNLMCTKIKLLNHQRYKHRLLLHWQSDQSASEAQTKRF